MGTRCLARRLAAFGGSDHSQDVNSRKLGKLCKCEGCSFNRSEAFGKVRWLALSEVSKEADGEAVPEHSAE